MAASAPTRAHGTRAAPSRSAQNAPTRLPDGRVLDLVALQRSAGNRAVSALVQRQRHQSGGDSRRPGGAHHAASPMVQRVPVTVPSREETLFNQRGTPGSTPGTAGAAVFGHDRGKTFDLARTGSPEAVVVTVRIRFFQEGRVLSAPDAQGRTHPVNDDNKSVIPPGDARRPFAQNICTTAPAHWNNRATLAGVRAAPGLIDSIFTTDTGGPVRLPIRFRAEPVWDLTSPVDSEVRVFPQSQAAGGPVHPVDAGHFYMNTTANYAGMDLEAIYAHEYGHLIGLSDEYSQSHPQMHALMHGMDPATSAQRSAAMTRESVRRMVLAALIPQLHGRVASAAGEISQQFVRAQAPVRSALGASVRTAMTDPTTIAMLQISVPPTAARLTPYVPRTLAAAARNPANTTAPAAAAVAAEFAPGPIESTLRRLYYSSLNRAATGVTDVGGNLGMHINIEGGSGITPDGRPAVGGATGLWAGGPANAGDLSAVVDQVAGASRTGRVPPLRASGSILRDLTSLPAGWAALAGGAPASMSVATVTNDVKQSLANAFTARVGAIILGGAAPTTTDRLGTFVAGLNGAARIAAAAASTNAVRTFLTSEIEPVVTRSTTSLMAAIGGEVTRIMGTPAEQLALTAPRDPAIASIASAMSTRLAVSSLTATASQIGALRPAVNPGTTAPAQEVTYSTVNMMSDNTDIFRADQFADIATVFNDSGLKRSREGDFRVEMGAT
ncbi:hypothetical protein GCM10009750_37040 [Agromyces salentinus]|uniref:Peptidase M10 metallopeptidase domain-containing protein n=2 Tax=Agromyces salentinus TaxID=269421 RepID=A0ABN2N1W1_9MICO